MNEIEEAKAQMNLYFLGRLGYGIEEMLNTVALTKEEWINIRKEMPFVILEKSLKQEMDTYFGL